MTTKQLDELKRLLAEATPRPWTLTRTSLEICIKHNARVIGTMLSVDEHDGKTDARLIASAVDALPSLLADLEAAQAQVKVLRDELTRLRDVVSSVEYDAIDAALAATEVKP
jgi:hypothetical protein